MSKCPLLAGEYDITEYWSNDEFNCKGTATVRQYLENNIPITTFHLDCGKNSAVWVGGVSKVRDSEHVDLISRCCDGVHDMRSNGFAVLEDDQWKIYWTDWQEGVEQVDGGYEVWKRK